MLFRSNTIHYNTLQHTTTHYNITDTSTRPPPPSNLLTPPYPIYLPNLLHFCVWTFFLNTPGGYVSQSRSRPSHPSSRESLSPSSPVTYIQRIHMPHDPFLSILTYRRPFLPSHEHEHSVTPPPFTPSFPRSAGITSRFCFLFSIYVLVKF